LILECHAKSDTAPEARKTPRPRAVTHGHTITNKKKSNNATTKSAVF